MNSVGKNETQTLESICIKTPTPPPPGPGPCPVYRVGLLVEPLRGVHVAQYAVDPGGPAVCHTELEGLVRQEGLQGAGRRVHAGVMVSLTYRVADRLLFYFICEQRHQLPHTHMATQVSKDINSPPQ